MSPDQLTELLTGLDRAAEVVEAIDRPELQVKRGWNLAQWRYDLIPWGVRFTYLGFDRACAEVLAVIPMQYWNTSPRQTVEPPWLVLAMN